MLEFVMVQEALSKDRGKTATEVRRDMMGIKADELPGYQFVTLRDMLEILRIGERLGYVHSIKAPTGEQRFIFEPTKVLYFKGDGHYFGEVC